MKTLIINSAFVIISLLFFACESKELVQPVIDVKLNGEARNELVIPINSIVKYQFSVISTEKINKISLFKTIDNVKEEIPIMGLPNGNYILYGGLIIGSNMKLVLHVNYGNNQEIEKETFLRIYISTKIVSEITFTSAKSGGSYDTSIKNIQSKGICWNSAPTPTIATGLKTLDTSGDITYSCEMKGLKPATKYFVRSFVETTDSVIYGNEITFSTLTPQVPTVPNGGFEEPTIDNPNGFSMNPTGAKWTFFSGGIGIQRNGGLFGAAKAPQGNQTAVMQGAGNINQTILFNEGYFAISLMAARRGTQTQVFEVSFDDVLLDTFTPATSEFEYFATRTFAATAGNHKIKIKATNPLGGDNSGFVDDVKIEYREKP